MSRVALDTFLQDSSIPGGSGAGLSKGKMADKVGYVSTFSRLLGGELF